LSRRPEAAGGDGWRVALSCPAAAVEAVMAALEAPDAAVTAFGDQDDWSIEAIVPEPPDHADLTARLALAAARSGVAVPAFTVAAVERRDWLALNLDSFRPIRIGRFVVHGAHHAPPGHRWGLRIDAATAFGTGEHPTTRACLEALDAVAKRKRLGRVLDLGTGSGLLAIAAKKLGARRVLAVDIDPESVRVAARHARLSRARIRVARSDGYRGRAVRCAGPYDLVLANILAGPLARMAPALARALAPGGVAVLSGLLTSQERLVLVAHRRAGLRLVRRRVIGDWTTLVVERRAQLLAGTTASMTTSPMP
jgi:ribosomal protein L11 methyltransferase